MSNNIVQSDNEYIKLDNTEPFQVLVVKINKIEDRDWTKSSYLKDLTNDTFCEYVNINSDNYIEKVGVFLETYKYAYPEINVHLISEETDYIMEIMYINVLDDYKTPENKNDFATLLCMEGHIIYGNAIITKTHIPSQIIYKDDMKDIEYKMQYTNIDALSVETMLHHRANTKVIVYDSDNESYEEKTIFGPLDKFAESFFEEAQYTYIKKEIGFLKHNINIWYSLHRYGSLNVFGNLLDSTERVDKMIVFSMWTDNYRCNFTLDEFNKIKKLSKKINIDYILPNELIEETRDKINRVVIKNKYRILNIICSKYNLI